MDHDEESGAKGASHPMGRLAMAGKYSRLEVTGEGANVLKGNGRGAPRPYLLVAFAMVEKRAVGGPGSRDHSKREATTSRPGHRVT